MRQPEIVAVEPAPPEKSAALMSDWVETITSSDRNKPKVAVVWIQLV